MSVRPSLAVCSLALLLGACVVEPPRRLPDSRAAPAEPERVAPRAAGRASQEAAPHGWIPTLPPPPRTVPPPLPVPSVPIQPQSPTPLTTCDPGGCWNSGAERYNGGSGDSYLGPGGRLCQRNGNWMQCF